MGNIATIITRLILISFLCSGISLHAQQKTTVNSDKQFIHFLEKSLKADVFNAEATKKFYERTRKYWREHMLDYNQNHAKYSRAISLYHQNQQKYVRSDSITIDRFENQIESFRHFDNRNTMPENAVLFIGSSSIVYWETAISFPDLQVINRGFGGASIPEIIYYYDDIIKKHSPSVIIVYCDIDIERGKSSDTVLSAYKKLVNKIEKDFPQTQILLLSMKPAMVDDFIGKNIRRNKIAANRMLREYCGNEQYLHYVDITSVMLKPDGKVRSEIFYPDGMHLNQAGYKLWDPIVRSEIMSLIK